MEKMSLQRVLSLHTRIGMGDEMGGLKGKANHKATRPVRKKALEILAPGKSIPYRFCLRRAPARNLRVPTKTMNPAQIIRNHGSMARLQAL